MAKRDSLLLERDRVHGGNFHGRHQHSKHPKKLCHAVVYFAAWRKFLRERAEGGVCVCVCASRVNNVEVGNEISRDKLPINYDARTDLVVARIYRLYILVARRGAVVRREFPPRANVMQISVVSTGSAATGGKRIHQNSWSPVERSFSISASTTFPLLLAAASPGIAYARNFRHRAPRRFRDFVVFSPGNERSQVLPVSSGGSSVRARPEASFLSISSRRLPLYSSPLREDRGRTLFAFSETHSPISSHIFHRLA